MTSSGIRRHSAVGKDEAHATFASSLASPREGLGRIKSSLFIYYLTTSLPIKFHFSSALNRGIQIALELRAPAHDDHMIRLTNKESISEIQDPTSKFIDRT